MTDQVHLTIDDQPVDVPKGTLVVEAAKRVGIHIPVYCYHPRLKPAGMCRMCLVEIGTPRRNADGSPALNADGTPVIAFMPKPQTACTTPVSPGMVVKTQTPAVAAARKGILEFLLINHPLDCPICDKGGECDLQDFTLAYGPGVSRFDFKDKLHFPKPVPLSDRILLDRERCILCGRCVRFQEEIAGDPEIGIMGRGAESYIDTFSGQTFASNFSGNTIELCPVGALTSREFRFRARPWEMRTTTTVCGRCPVGCAVKVQVRDNQVMRILAGENEAVNEVWLCDRGRFGYGDIHAPNRLQQPLIRRNGQLVAATWDEALALTADRLSAAAGAVAGLIAPSRPNEALYLFQKLFKAVLRSAAVDHRPDGGPELAGDYLHASIADLEHGRTILVIGSDLFNDYPLLALRVRKAMVQRGAKVIYAQAKPVKFTEEATVWLRHKPGQETALVKALLSGLEGKPFDAAHGQPFDAVNQEKAMAILKSAPAMILYGPKLSKTALAGLKRLARVTGSTLHGLVPPDGANVQGARDMGVVTPINLHARAEAGELAALYVVGLDLAASWGEATLSKVGFLVVQEVTLTPTAAQADVVLPGVTFVESDGTFTNLERRVQRLRRAVVPRGEAKPDWQIIAALGRRLSGEDWTYDTAAAVLAEIAQNVPDYSRCHDDQLGPEGVRL